jgi:hypothetical protein
MFLKNVMDMPTKCIFCNNINIRSDILDANKPRK